ncbi:MAG: hypothetical protein L3J02_03230 [Henriciella sp.]|nr:hypothetical protein [Henriciella sp.]
MDTAQIAEPLTGDKLYQQRARQALPFLIRQAQAEEPITYENLASELKMPNPRNLNYVLGSIGKALNNLSDLWGEDVPPLQCLVVNKGSGLPGEGISWFIRDLADYNKLSRRQRRQVIDTELTKIYGYTKWSKVLKKFGLKAAQQDFTSFNKKASVGGRGGGESKEHQELKKYVSTHPHSIGLPANIFPGDIEHNLPSGDTIDVFFENKKEHIGVEVKSAYSDIGDVTRGLYQCIKYQAVLEARLAATGKPQNVRTMLVLGGPLPMELFPLRNILGVEVVENIKEKIG